MNKQITAIAFDLEGTLLEMLDEQDAITNLKKLKKSYKLGIGSNGGVSQLAAVEAAGVANLFGVSFMAPVMGIHKPDPEFFIQLAGWMNTPVGQVLFIGDSMTNDIDGAKNAGMYCCLYTSQPNNYDGMIIHSLADLISQLELNE